MPTVSKEDYLKTIYQRIEEGEQASTSSIARTLKVSNAAATDMLKKLSLQGFVNYKKYKGVSLTAKGRKEALSLLRRHRLWELFLMKVLKLKWDEVHKEAELLEHKTSEKLIDKIDQYLNHPKFDPHGAPIPDKRGVLPKEKKFIRLDAAKENKIYTIVKVNDKDDELIRYFAEIGFKLNTKFEVKKIFNIDGTITVKNKKGQFNLSPVVAKNIFVREVRK